MKIKCLTCSRGLRVAIRSSVLLVVSRRHVALYRRVALQIKKRFPSALTLSLSFIIKSFKFSLEMSNSERSKISRDTNTCHISSWNNLWANLAALKCNKISCFFLLIIISKETFFLLLPTLCVRRRSTLKLNHLSGTLV